MNFSKIFTNKKPLILASKSPQRANILNMLKIPFQTEPSNYQEILPKGNLNPEKIAMDFALAKALDVQKKFPDHIILGVDTLVVSIEGKILGKPKNKKQASQMILNKSGKTETVISGIALIKGDKQIVRSEKSIIHFAKISEKVIDEILSWNEWQNRSGSFSVEGKSTLFIEKIDGDFWNVVGLPACLLGRMIDEMM